MNIEQSLNEHISSNRFRLPAPPDIYLRILEVVENEGSLQEVESILKYDASITARLIQVANSPALRGSGKVSSALSALTRLGTRLGTKLTSSLVLGLSMRDRFSLKGAGLKDVAAKVWDRGVYAGVAASVLAKELRPDYKFSPEVALTAGIMHNIGYLPILDFFSQNQLEVARFQEVEHMAGELGARILSTWSLSQDLIECTALSSSIPMAPDKDTTYFDLVALVLLAKHSDSEEVNKSYGDKVGIDVEGVTVVLSEYSKEFEELITLIGI